ncbi:MAG: GGDEF domain-containing protein [Clostridiales bacterium]|nr:GGDEF domain-containing protein [Clostridiales bacterium]
MNRKDQQSRDIRYIDKIDRLLSRNVVSAAYYFALVSCLLAHIMYVVLFAACGVTFMVIFNACSVLFYIVSIFLVRLVKEKLILIYASIAEIVLQAVAATVCVGLAPNFNMFLLMIVPLAFLMPNKNKVVPFVILLISVPLYGVMYYYYSVPGRAVYDISNTHFEIVFYVINIFIGSVVLIYVAVIFTMMNSYVESKLRIMASTDPLTKLYNRREMNYKLNEVVRSCKDSGYIIGIGDIDDFKKVNDTYGHDMGDVVLADVASIVSGTLPVKGTAARWGGEEFLFVIPDSDIEEGRKYADGIIDAIRRKEFKTEDASFSVTMTIGICLGMPGDKIDNVISCADGRLYNGKRNGKAHTEYS